MAEHHCKSCDSPAGSLPPLEGHAGFRCPRCGDYWLSGTVHRELELGTIQLPEPDRFKELVRKKRGASALPPVITTYDLGH